MELSSWHQVQGITPLWKAQHSVTALAVLTLGQHPSDRHRYLGFNKVALLYPLQGFGLTTGSAIPPEWNRVIAFISRGTIKHKAAFPFLCRPNHPWARTLASKTFFLMRQFSYASDGPHPARPTNFVQGQPKPTLRRDKASALTITEPFLVTISKLYFCKIRLQRVSFKKRLAFPFKYLNAMLTVTTLKSHPYKYSQNFLTFILRPSIRSQDSKKARQS